MGCRGKGTGAFIDKAASGEHERQQEIIQTQSLNIDT